MIGLTLIAVPVLAILYIWIGQSIALILVGEKLAWPLRFETRDPRVKLTSRVMIHSTWILIIVLVPLVLGISPLEWFHQQFPTPVPWRDILVAIAIMVIPIWILYAIWFAAGWIRWEPKHDTKTRRAKLFRRFIGPWPLATLEEAVFRGVLLDQLLRAFPQTDAYAGLAIVVTAAIFSSIHFVKRPQPGRPIWQPAYGLFIVGCLFGLAYVLGGRSLWLPIAVHGGAVFGIEVMRLYMVHQGPPWLVGYAEFPQSGLMGSLFVLGMAIALVVLI